MLVKNREQVVMKAVEMDDTQDVQMAVLIGDDEGAPNFIMRRFEVQSGGHTPYHTHDWEHVVYILEGSGKLVGKGVERTLKAGSSLLVSPNEEHQFRADKDSGLTFLCSIPKR